MADNLTASQFVEKSRTEERFCVVFTQEMNVNANRLAALAEQYKARAVPVYTVDIDREPGVAARCGVHFLPAAVIIFNGVPGPVEPRMCESLTKGLQ